MRAATTPAHRAGACVKSINRGQRSFSDVTQTSAVQSKPLERRSLSDQPIVSVVVEGYNEMALATSVTDVLDGLTEQDYPLELIELILVGTDEAQLGRWEKLKPTARSFRRVVVVDAEGDLYYLLKNRGADAASGDVVAFIDSDVYPAPGWVSSIVQAMNEGADVTGGISMMRNIGASRAPKAVLEAAAAVSFGHVVGHQRGPSDGQARAVVAHNLAFRSEVLERYRFDTRLGRNCAIGMIYETLKEDGLDVRLVPGQRVAHSFSPRWFLWMFHVRVGWEEHTLRRVDRRTPNRWMVAAGPVEPMLTTVVYVGFDLGRWLRFSRYLGIGGLRRWVRLPLVLAVSVGARVAGMVGMYAAMVAPERSRAWAEAQ
jgi:glycosyltransferase involved in cell wall biosynthesis